MLKKKQTTSLQELFNQDAILLEQAFHAMSKAVSAYMMENEADKKDKSHETIKVEKEQDQLRAQIIERLFSKETMVFSRADRLMIIEKMDKIVDECEIVVRKLLQFNPKFPENMKENMKKIVQNITELGTALKNLIINVFTDFSQCQPYITKITDLRREVRELHWNLLEMNYTLNNSPLEFSYFRDLIKAVAKVADRGEEFADQLFGLICKYSI